MCAGGGHGQVLGLNVSGQLGDGTTTNGSTPVSVTGITDARSISASWSQACALLASGTVQCWGAGPLGDGSTANSSTPVTAALPPSIAIDLGSSPCAVGVDGLVRCWNGNSVGDLGNGFRDNDVHPTPTVVQGLTSAARAVSTGDGDCALTVSGPPQCWGGQWGGCGENPFDHTCPPPAPAAADWNPKVIARDECSIVALGAVTCGGTGTPDLHYGAAGLTNAISVAVGLYPSSGSACAYISDGPVKCWGQNGSGQSGRRNHNRTIHAGYRDRPVNALTPKPCSRTGRGPALYVPIASTSRVNVIGEEPLGIARVTGAT